LCQQQCIVTPVEDTELAQTVNVMIVR